MNRRHFLHGLGVTAVVGALPVSVAAATDRIGKPLVIKIFGIGGAGNNIINGLLAARVEGVSEYVCIDTDMVWLNRSRAQRKILLGDGTPLTGRPPGEAQVLAYARREELIAAMAGTDVAIVIAGLGGNAGSGIASPVVNFALLSGALAATVVVTPYPFEGIRRVLAADAGMVMVQNNAHVAMAISNAAIAESFKGDVTLRDAFAASDKAVRRAVETILVFAKNGTIGIHG